MRRGSAVDVDREGRAVFALYTSSFKNVKETSTNAPPYARRVMSRATDTANGATEQPTPSAAQVSLQKL